MKLDRVTCGFVPLTDSAVLIAAAELGFAAEEGIDLALVREPSWSNIRDKISLGAYPAAHLLSPMAVALSLGLGPMPVKIDAAFVLSLNGNTLTATPALAEELRALGGVAGDASLMAAAFRQLAQRRRLRVGVPFPQSMHLLLVRYFLNAAGVAADRIDWTVAPPPILPEVLSAGEVDVFMVGEPWGSLSVERGAGAILLPGAAIWRAAPEKVLGLRRDWAEDNPDLVRRLIRALYRAAQWCGRHQHDGVLAEVLARPAYLDCPALLIERALVGELVLNPGGALLSDPLAIRLTGDLTNFPWRSGGAWIAQQAAAHWGVPQATAMAEGAQVFRSDLYRQAVGTLGAALPAASAKVEGMSTSVTDVPGTQNSVSVGPDAFFDEAVFDVTA